MKQNNQEPIMQIDKLTISHSSRSMFASCARKLEFRKFYSHSKRDESLATLAGSALHAAYQDFLIHKNRERATFILMTELHATYDVSPLKPRSLEACYSTLLAMMDFQGYSEYELAYIDVAGERRPAIEVPFRIRIKDFSLDDKKETPVEYIGFIDMIMYNILRDEFVVTDIKTHTRTLSDLSPIYTFDDQCLPYALILETILNQPLNNLQVQYMSCFIDLTEPKVRNFSFMKSKQDIQDWSTGFALDLQLIKLYYNQGWFPRRGSACTNFNKPCNFFNLCQTRDPSAIESLLEFDQREEYIPPEFNPWFDIELKLQI